MIGTFRLLSACLLFSVTGSSAFASPTIDGVDARTEGDAQVYADTNDENVLWVTPPTTGSLRTVNEGAFFVDQNLCKNAAAVNSRKNRFLNVINATQDKIFDAYERRDTGDVTVTDAFLKELTDRIEMFEMQAGDIKYDQEMFEAGGNYSYVAKSGHVGILQTVRSKNPDNTVQPIQAKVTGITPSLSNGSNNDSVDNIFLDVGIPNLGGLASPVEEVQVDVKLSKLGSCYVAYPEIMSGGAELFKFGFIVNYEHPFLFAERVTASYNLKRVYQRIEKTKRKKRFFSSKTYASVVESTELKSDLNVKVISDKEFGPLVKLQLQNQARELVLNVAVTEMVAKLKEAGEVGKTGAEIAADELNKNCGTNVYCQGAAGVLRVLDGIFGGNSQTSSLTKILDHQVNYSSVAGETLQVSRSISYVSD